MKSARVPKDPQESRDKEKVMPGLAGLFGLLEHVLKVCSETLVTVIAFLPLLGLSPCFSSKPSSPTRSNVRKVSIVSMQLRFTVQLLDN